MKNLVLFSIIILLTSSCFKEQQEPKFEMSYPTRDFILPAGLSSLETFIVEIPNIPTNIANYYATFGTNENEIESILPGEMTLISIDGTPLNFLYEVSVKLSGPENPDTKHEIFYDDRVSNRANATLPLIPNANDMKHILSKDKFTLQIEFRQFKEPTTRTLDMLFNLSFKAY